jgi:2-polyprenyl-6-methoxyphenol hydroxylase-like FAD-dependent oxidoreductase
MPRIGIVGGGVAGSQLGLFLRKHGIASPLDVGHAAITPAVRRGYARLRNGKLVVALGDAHIVMDPVTGQGANKASHAAWVLGEAIRDAGAFDEEFCRRVEQRTCEYALPVSDACNARLQPPPPHVAKFLGAAAQHQAVADFYTDGFNHPDHVWRCCRARSGPRRWRSC